MESAKYEYSHVAALFDSLIEKLEAQYATTNADFDAEREALIKSLEAMVVPETETDEWDGERREEEREAQKLREKEVDSKIEVRRKRELRKQSQAITLTWIVYMRTARRMQNMKTARSVFSKARKSPLCTYHIFVASGILL
jgi:cleavage stimulation factor subunit 3